MISQGAILGVGNVLYRDDGIGVKIINYLDAYYQFPDNVDLIDGGTVGAGLNNSVFRKNWLIVIDALSVDGAPGQVRVISGEDFINKKTGQKMSPHQVGFLDLLQLMKLEGTGPLELDLIGVIPENTTEGTEISPVMDKALPQVLEHLFALLKDKNIVLTKRQPAMKPNYWWLTTR